MVATEGVSALNMERLGKEAGMSKSLVYAYYPSMKDLQQTFEQLVRRVTTTYLSYLEERGLIFAGKPATVVDMTVTMIVGRVEALKQNYETALKPLGRISES